MDNRGNRIIVSDTDSAINTPAIGAAHVVNSYTAKAHDELTLEVSISAIFAIIWIFLQFLQVVQKCFQETENEISRSRNPSGWNSFEIVWRATCYVNHWGHHDNKGWSDVNFYATLKLCDLEKPLFGTTLLALYLIQADL